MSLSSSKFHIASDRESYQRAKIVFVHLKRKEKLNSVRGETKEKAAQSRKMDDIFCRFFAKKVSEVERDEL